MQSEMHKSNSIDIDNLQHLLGLTHSSILHHMLMTSCLPPEREMRSETARYALDLSHTLPMQSVISGASKCACAYVCAAAPISLCDPGEIGV